ncbi:hypothetical protein BIW11_04246 [Tropilaelaps mercedesae]|uniref:Uncharacterized protein n=1 Tax=Tropilaelaps mercedesae TaxID=418985 RepID=A0A1V9X8X9_9ACAR|nr:hypothetical protein BIW11_04246 [Tropilaelaps mercedesae]
MHSSSVAGAKVIIEIRTQDYRHLWEGFVLYFDSDPYCRELQRHADCNLFLDVSTLLCVLFAKGEGRWWLPLRHP